MKKALWLLVTISIIILLVQVKLSSKESMLQAEAFPVIIDTSTFQAADRQESWLTTSSCNYMYIGKYRDTIVANYDLEYISSFEEEINEDLKEYHFYWLEVPTYKHWDISTIEIQIDTSTKVKNRDIHADWNHPYFKAYPLILKNKERDTIIIGHGNFISLIMEAKDSLNFWRPIEEEQAILCGNGVGSVVLPPSEMVLTAVMIYQGTYKTELRIRIGENYSAPFKGSINYRQFESMFNEKGGYRKEYLEEENKKISR